MNKYYSFTVEGTSGEEAQTWTATGVVECEFKDVFGTVLGNAFQKLTSGRAIFGKPGVGCSGPYDIDRIVIEQVRQ